jgi:NAD(P)-dependent dehydrogenase (short-subunit alcohol dehydrogenase family)
VTAASLAGALAGMTALVLPPLPWVFLPVAVTGFALFQSFGLTVTLGQDYLPSRIGTSTGVTLGLAISTGGLLAPAFGAIADAAGLHLALVILLAFPPAALALTLRLRDPRPPAPHQPLPGIPHASAPSTRNMTSGGRNRDSGPGPARTRAVRSSHSGKAAEGLPDADGGTVMDRQVVLVTGASRGLGRATAELLAGHGYRVFGTARHPSGNEPGDVTMLPLNVTSDESVRSCVSAVLEEAGQIDVLVNNAGTGLIGAVEETPVGDARALFDANLFGLARMACAVLPGMRQRRRGLIVNLGSMAPAVPTPFHGYLSASKAAVRTFTDALRLEVAPFGITVTTVEPGAMATHPGESFAALRVPQVIGDYAGPEQRASAVYASGQQAGRDPRLVAGDILRVIRAGAPAAHYTVGTGKERLAVLACRLLPSAAVESLAVRHFRLAG